MDCFGECMQERDFILTHDDAFVAMRWARYLNQIGIDGKDIEQELKQLTIVLEYLRRNESGIYLTYPEYILIKRVSNVLQHLSGSS